MKRLGNMINYIRLNLPLVRKQTFYSVSLVILTFFLLTTQVHAKEFTDNLTTDFYGGECIDNVFISQNTDGEIQLAPYALLGGWFSSEGPSSTSLYLSAATVYNGKIYLCGGFGSDESRSLGGAQVANAMNKVWYGNILSDGKIQEWKEVDDTSILPQPMYGHSAITVNGRLYIMGGRSTADSTLSSVYWAKILGHDGSIKAYYRSNTWNAVASLPQPRFRSKTVQFEGRIYVIGGQDSSDIAQDTVYYANVEPDGNIWNWNQATSPLPARLSGHCVGISNGRIYVLGGSTTGESIDASANVYVGTIDPVSGDVINWVQTTNLPSPLYGADATIAAGKIWVAGGFNSGTARADIFYARINRIDGLIPGPGERDTWSRSTDIPISVYNHNLVSFNGHLFIIGGYNSAGIQKYVYTSNNATPKLNITRWVPTTPLFHSAYGAHVYNVWAGHTAALKVPLVDDTISATNSGPTVYVIGGGPNTYLAYANGVGDISGSPPAAYSSVYNSAIDSSGSLGNWSAPDTGGNVLYASILHSSTVANGGLYVIGGANSTNAFIWAGAASRSICAIGVQTDLLNRPCQIGETEVMYEEVSNGSSSGGIGTMKFTASIPIYDPAYEAGGAAGYVANTATPIYQPLMRHVTVSHNGNIYVIGGISRQNLGWDGNGEPAGGSEPVFENRVWMCRPNPGGTINYSASAGGWKTTTPLVPSATAPSLGRLYDMAACVAYNRIYIFGGRSGELASLTIPQDDVYFANINQDGTLGEWNEISTSTIPVFIAEHQVVFTNGKFYLIGGVNQFDVLQNTVYYCTLDPTTGLIPASPNPGSWEFSNTTLEYPVAGHSALTYNGYIYILGGRYNTADPHSSSAYMTNVIDLYQTQDIVYAWNGNFERYIDMGSDQLIQNFDWLGLPNNETMQVKIRFGKEQGPWTDWTPIQTIGPVIVNQFAQFIHYKVHMETLTNERLNVFRTPVLDKVMVDYASSNPMTNDNFLINHNKFDPQIEPLLVSYKTRDHEVAEVVIRVFNLEGELIRRQDFTIPAAAPLPYTGSWQWDGTNENNEIVANGVYIIQYNSGNTHKIRRVVVFKK